MISAAAAAAEVVSADEAAAVVGVVAVVVVVVPIAWIDLHDAGEAIVAVAGGAFRETDRKVVKATAERAGETDQEMED